MLGCSSHALAPAHHSGQGPGFSEDAVGFLQAIVYAVVYIVPILGGALAEKYGYRRMLILSFCLLESGYWITGTFHTYGLIFAALLFMAFGAGLFKPIISGTIAHSTSETKPNCAGIVKILGVREIEASLNTGDYRDPDYRKRSGGNSTLAGSCRLANNKAVLDGWTARRWHGFVEPGSNGDGA